MMMTDGQIWLVVGCRSSPKWCTRKRADESCGVKCRAIWSPMREVGVHFGQRHAIFGGWMRRMIVVLGVMFEAQGFYGWGTGWSDSRSAWEVEKSWWHKEVEFRPKGYPTKTVNGVGRLRCGVVFSNWQPIWTILSVGEPPPYCSSGRGFARTPYPYIILSSKLNFWLGLALQKLGPFFVDLGTSGVPVQTFFTMPH